jgi:hypothetical protein
MARKPNQVQLSFRINDDLHRKLVRAAEQNRTTINTEMKLRIERSFEQDRSRKLEDLVEHLEQVWYRYGVRFLELDLQDELLSALAGQDFDKARVLANAILKTREANLRERLDKTSRDVKASARVKS